MENASFVNCLQTKVSYSCCHDSLLDCNGLRYERGLLNSILGKGECERKGNGCLADELLLRSVISVQDVSARHLPQVTFLQGYLCSYKGCTD